MDPLYTFLKIHWHLSWGQKNWGTIFLGKRLHIVYVRGHSNTKCEDNHISFTSTPIFTLLMFYISFMLQNYSKIGQSTNNWCWQKHAYFIKNWSKSEIRGFSREKVSGAVFPKSIM